MNKEEFVIALAAEGYDADFANNGIPTVFVDTCREVSKMAKIISTFAVQNDYHQSFGIKPKQNNAENKNI